VAVGVLILAALTNLNCAHNTERRIQGPYSFTVEVVPGVHLLAMLPKGTELVPTYLGVCSYLVEGSNGRHILIDSGQQNQTETLVQLLAGQNVKPSDIEMVVCTHAHSDHVGGCAFLQRQGAKIAIHKLAGEYVDAKPPFKDPNSRRDEHEKGIEPFRPDIRFSDGDILRAGDIELRVIHTPGHTPDSCSFVLNRSGKTILFIGDLYGWYIIEWGSDQKQMLESVRKARDVRADYVCYGHNMITEDLPGFWDKLEKSVGDGIFQLVDQHDYTSNVTRTGKKVLESRPKK
jgi:glyoxylase-like metal-dependent hydrolase (beta-lactamase superfamily II)